MKLEIERSLIVSSSHVPESASRHLAAASVATADGTWWMFNVNASEDFGTPACLLPLLALARENRCDWLIVDGDGPEVDGFPTYSWS